MEQNQDANLATTAPYVLHFGLGTFEGFNFRHQGAIDRLLTAEEVVNWDHDADGEAEFWPSGDHAGVSLLFSSKSTVTASELTALDGLLLELGEDSNSAFLHIHYLVNTYGEDIAKLTAVKIWDLGLHVFEGASFLDIRREAAFVLFELYYPEEYTVWEKSHCDGLIFDEDRFLDSPSWSVEEITLGDAKALIVAPQ